MDDVINQHPNNELRDTGGGGVTDKKWARNKQAIRPQRLRMHVQYDDSTFVQADWSALGEEYADDDVRRAQWTTEPNLMAIQEISNEEDIKDWYKREIIGPVLSKFTTYPPVRHQGDRTQLDGRGGNRVDSIFYLTLANTSNRREILIADYKHNVLDPSAWMNRQFTEQNQIRLGKELRGYAEEYECPLIICFDTNWTMFLQFRAESRPSDIAAAETEIDCWILPNFSRSSPYVGHPLRDAVYRFLVAGIRRLQRETQPLPMFTDFQPSHRLWFSGEPFVQHGRERHFASEYGYTLAESGSALAWLKNGQWFIAQNGNAIWDSCALTSFI